MSRRCHHPPFVLTLDRGSASGQALDGMVARMLEDPTRPVVAVGTGFVTVDVVECSWCRRPENLPVEAGRCTSERNGVRCDRSDDHPGEHYALVDEALWSWPAA